MRAQERPRRLVLGARGSPLSRAQAQRAADALARHAPDVAVDLRIVATTGDARPDAPLAELGLGVFTKELEDALLSGEIDVAVHSLKDVSATPPEALTLAAVLEREDPRDVLVSRTGALLSALPAGAVVGTSSPRRAALVLAVRPDVAVAPIRGNVETRLGKLRRGDFDAIVLAAAGLLRLGRESEVTERLDPSTFTPAVGQGAIALQSRRDDAALSALLAALDHAATRAAVTAERAFLRAMGGGCKTPLAAYGALSGGRLSVAGFVGSADGARSCRADVAGDAADAAALGESLAQALLAQGAAALLAEDAEGAA